MSSQTLILVIVTAIAIATATVSSMDDNNDYTNSTDNTTTLGNNNNNNNNHNHNECNELVCGWFAAIIAAFSAGTFGVPIKQTLEYDVHPLVLQSYKTITLFLCSWIFVLSFGEELKWTPHWGILSGILWVLGGMFNVFAIRTVGMAITGGTWSCMNVIINFIWGIIIFQEPIYSFRITCLAFVLLLIGLVGMTSYMEKSSHHNTPTYYRYDILSSSVPSSSILPTSNLVDKRYNDETMKMIELVTNFKDSTTTTCTDPGYGSDRSSERSRKQSEIKNVRQMKNTIEYDDNDEDNKTALHSTDASSNSNSSSSTTTTSSSTTTTSSSSNSNGYTTTVELIFDVVGRWLGFQTRQQIGLVCAILSGIFTGSAFLPIHYAKMEGFGGMSYIISFSCGSMIANCIIWIILFLFQYYSYCFCNSSNTNCTSQQQEEEEQQQQRQEQQQQEQRQQQQSLIVETTEIRTGDSNNNNNNNNSTNTSTIIDTGTTSILLTNNNNNNNNDTLSSSFSSSFPTTVFRSTHHHHHKNYYHYNYYYYYFHITYQRMPKWYMKELWKQAIIAGLLLSISKFGIILAISTLGQGIGNSIVQSKILINGLWGICWFHEIQQKSYIIKWFLFAWISIIAILCLSYERIAATTTTTTTLIWKEN